MGNNMEVDGMEADGKENKMTTKIEKVNDFLWKTRIKYTFRDGLALGFFGVVCLCVALEGTGHGAVIIGFAAGIEFAFVSDMLVKAEVGAIHEEVYNYAVRLGLVEGSFETEEKYGKLYTALKYGNMKALKELNDEIKARL